MYDVLLKGASVVLESGCQRLDIAVAEGKIAKLCIPGEEVPEAKCVIDCTGKVIFPGAIDTHGHMLFRENFDVGTMNAAKGGVTTVVEMPLCNQNEHWPNTLTRELFEEKVALGNSEAHVDFALWGGLTRTTMSRIRELHEAGCVGFKAFISYAGEDYPYLDDYALMESMKQIRDLGSIIAIHAENESICSALTKKYREEKRGPEFFEPSRPVIAEAEAAGRAAFFARKTGCKTVVCHVSCSEVLDEVLRNRTNGEQIYAESCPHYLSLDTMDIARCAGFAKCSPPLRAPIEKDLLWERVAQGEVDVIGADHSGYRTEEKERDIWDAPGGFVGLDLFMQILISEGMNKRGLSAERIAEISSVNASKLLGLYPQKGCIAEGSDADFAIVDPDEEWVFHTADSFYIESDERYPVENRKFTGNVVVTMVRGEVVYENGKIVMPKGYGKFVRPQR